MAILKKCGFDIWVYFETRKLSYRKDDRAMRPIGLYGYPENFRESLSTNTATFPDFPIRMWVQNLKT